MSGYEPRQNPACYEGTETLVNKAGIRDAGKLAAFERVVAAERTLTLPLDAPTDLKGYRALHLHLLQDVYGWAGEYRTFTTGRGSARFCEAPHIAKEMEKRFARIAAEDGLKGLTPEAFAKRAAHHVNELNAIHPFVDGNGRTNRAFLKVVARAAGHWIDLARIDPKRWNHASVEGFHRSDETMADVIGLAIAGAARDEPAIELRPTRGRNPERAKGAAGRTAPAHGQRKGRGNEVG